MNIKKDKLLTLIGLDDSYECTREITKAEYDELTSDIDEINDSKEEAEKAVKEREENE